MMGFVYVMTNEAMPGLVKIGFTTIDADTRARDLSSASGVPIPFQVEYVMETESPDWLEFCVHESLGTTRLNPNREFFRVTVDQAADAIERAAQSEIFWRRALFTVWNRGAQDWRERALDAMDQPAFDKMAAAIGKARK